MYPDAPVTRQRGPWRVSSWSIALRPFCRPLLITSTAGYGSDAARARRSGALLCADHVAAANQRDQDERPESGAGGTPTDLYAFAVRLRRMNGEINRLVRGFAVDHGLHATSVSPRAR